MLGLRPDRLLPVDSVDG